MYNDLINPRLYQALASQFGTVQVSNAGVVPSRQLRFRPDGGTYADYKNGEQFRVNCPYCDPPDTRHHLYFSCYWGTRTDEYPEDGRRLRLAHCFRCNALDAPHMREELYFRVYSTLPATSYLHDTGRIPLERGPVCMPGTIVPLDKLEPWHPAYRFMVTKGFDPSELGQRFRVGLCVVPPGDLQMVDGRIIIPVYKDDGTLAGWQARCVGDFDWKAVGWTKYYNLPGFSKSTYLYNHNEAKRYALRVVVEGATKVWRFGGGPCVGTFGSTLSPTQAALLAEAPGPIVWLWDGDSWDVPPGAERSKVDTALSLLHQYVPAARVVCVRLLSNYKPTSYDRQSLWGLVRTALDAAGWKIPLDATAESVAEALPIRQVARVPAQ